MYVTTSFIHHACLVALQCIEIHISLLKRWCWVSGRGHISWIYTCQKFILICNRWLFFSHLLIIYFLLKEKLFDDHFCIYIHLWFFHFFFFHSSHEFLYFLSRTTLAGSHYINGNEFGLNHIILTWMNSYIFFEQPKWLDHIILTRAMPNQNPT